MPTKKYSELTKREQDAYWAAKEKLREFKRVGVPAKRCTGPCGRSKATNGV